MKSLARHIGHPNICLLSVFLWYWSGGPKKLMNKLYVNVFRFLQMKPTVCWTSCLNELTKRLWMTLTLMTEVTVKGSAMRRLTENTWPNMGVTWAVDKENSWMLSTSRQCFLLSCICSLFETLLVVLMHKWVNRCWEVIYTSDVSNASLDNKYLLSKVQGGRTKVAHFPPTSLIKYLMSVYP